jgi:hypothetical protein
MLPALVNWRSLPVGAECRRVGASGTHTLDLKRRTLSALATFVLFLAGATAPAADADEDQPNATSSQILSKYLQATQTHEDSLRGASMEVEINASVPKLKENGNLHALRKISRVGQITYHVLGFQGDNTVKNQVIARYLQAEQQGQGDGTLAITEANYKFKYKGEKQTTTGQSVYVFSLNPRKKKVGLFKGEMWLDRQTCLPVFEKGRLVKNPSIFFKKVDFERAFAIKNGVAIPSYMNSTIDTRLIGKVELSINYSHFAENGGTVESDSSSEVTATTAHFGADRL